MARSVRVESVKVKESQEMATEKWNDYLEKLIDLFHPFLLDTLKVAHLICHLSAIDEIKEAAPSIHQKENDGKYRQAAEEFLFAIKSSDQPGKWQMLLDALKQVEDTVILKTLLDEKDPADPWLDDQANLKLIQMFSSPIEEHLNLADLLGKMLANELIRTEDQEQLRSMINGGKRRGAIAVLLLIMHRHNSDWYKIFLSILCEDDHHIRLAKKIDPEFVSKKCTQEKSQKLSDGAPLSLGVNLGHRSPSKEKVLGPKLLPDTDHSTHDRGDASAPASQQMETTCGCRCCAVVLAKVTSLESELAAMKALLMHLVEKKSQLL